MIWWIVAVAVALYFALGIATATLAIVVEGEPKDDGGGFILLTVAFWPVILAIDLPIFIARRIKARHEAKPAPFEDQLL